MATIEDQRKEWALQGLGTTVTAPTEQVSRPPAWHEYLSGITKGMEARGASTSPFPSAFPTQRRREMQEQARQFDQQIALQRAEAARRAAEAKQAAAAKAQQYTPQDYVDHMMSLVDIAIRTNRNISPDEIWKKIEMEILRNSGQFPKEFNAEAARYVAGDYLAHLYPGFQPVPRYDFGKRATSSTEASTKEGELENLRKTLFGGK